MKSKRLKGVVALLIALIMAISVCPVSAFAAVTKTTTLTTGTVGPSPNGAVKSIPCEWKKVVASGTVNGTLTSYNTIGRNSSNRYFEAKAVNSKSVTKMVADYKAVKHSTGATISDPSAKSASNTNTVSLSAWQYSGATYEITNYTTTESRSTNSYAEYITHIY